MANSKTAISRLSKLLKITTKF